MTLIRRCDGCGKDIVDVFSTELLQIRLPVNKALRDELDFHSVDCIALWIQRGHR